MTIGSEQCFRFIFKQVLSVRRWLVSHCVLCSSIFRSISSFCMFLHYKLSSVVASNSTCEIFGRRPVELYNSCVLATNDADFYDQK